MVDDQLFVDYPVMQPHEPDREVFDSTDVAALPHQEQSLFDLAGDVGAAEGPPSKLSEDSVQTGKSLSLRRSSRQRAPPRLLIAPLLFEGLY